MFFQPSRNDSRIKVHGGRGGRSKVELTRDEELAKAREERERRRRQKLEQKSAVKIQAAWRGWSSRRTTRTAIRGLWIERYGSYGEKLQARDCLCASAGAALGNLLSFYRPETDWQQLASVARVVAAALRTDASSEYMASFNVAETRASLLYQLKALALQCLLTLHQRRREFAPLLAAARPSAPLDPAVGGAGGSLLECILLMVSPEPYTAALGKHQATSLAAALLAHLASHGMFGKLFHLLIAALLPPPPSSSPRSPAAQRQQQQRRNQHAAAAAVGHVVAAKPYVETLTTQLTVRLLALKSFSPWTEEDSPHMLLIVPDVWRRCSSLQPVAARLARAAVNWLAAAGPHRLATLLPHKNALPGGSGTAVAVLLANILAVGPRILEADKATGAAPGARRAVALNVARVLHAVVSLLPLDPFFPDPVGGADENEDEVDESACGSLGLTRLALQPGAVAQLPTGLVAAVQGLIGLPGRQLLKQLVAVLLPHGATPPPSAVAGTVFASAATPVPQCLAAVHRGPLNTASLPPASVVTAATAAAAAAAPLQRLSSHGYPHQSVPLSPAALLDGAEAAHALCELLWQMAQLPGQRQRVLLAAAVSCDLVERLWGSFLRHARQADLCGVAWLSPETAAGGSTTLLRPCGSIHAPCSASSSYTCAGPALMEVELPAALSSGLGEASGGQLGGLALRSTSGSGCMLTDTSGSGDSAAAVATGFGGGGGGWLGAGGAVAGPVTGGLVSWRPRLSEDMGWMMPLAVACGVFTAHVSTSTLEEFYEEPQRPLPLQQLYDEAAPEAGFLALLRDSLWQALWSDGASDRSPAGDALYAVLTRTGGLLYGMLYERNCRRAFCPTEAFHASALAPDWFLAEASSSRSHAGREDGSARVWQVLHHAPYLVPFADRARLFQQIVGKEREEYRNQEDSLGGMQPGRGNRFVQIRRDRLLFDGFDNLNVLGDRLRGRVRITFIDAYGAPEAGVDGGGLFKDFMEELMRAGLSAEYGLFTANSSHEHYPNPAAMTVVDDAPRLLAFLGRMLGKAMYENILLELPLAGFFLKKFRGERCDLNDLPTLDPELYRSLMKLKDHMLTASAAAAAAAARGSSSEGSQHGGGAAAEAMDLDLDLGLTFVVADEAAAALGDPSVEVELKPGGRHIAVTADNVNEYIHRVAHYKLNVAPRPAVSAFLSGFYELMPCSWVAMFSGEELQTLISGAEQSLDIEDMREHVVYGGEYHDDHQVIQWFWAALSSFNPEQQGKFLKFVTSCSRAPLLGFKYLVPHLGIQISAGVDRLPTASTCMNLLKLPPYPSLEIMREKLLYAITSGAGFDLS